MHLWRLDCGAQTLVLTVADGRMAEAIHWGRSLPLDEDLAALAAAHRSDLGGGTLDAVAPLSICPDARAGFPGQPGMVLRRLDGAPLVPRLRFFRAEGADPLSLHFRDEAEAIGYAARFESFDTGVMTATAQITSDAPFIVHWLAAPVLPGPQAGSEIVDWHGTWLREFHRNPSP